MDDGLEKEMKEKIRMKRQRRQERKEKIHRGGYSVNGSSHKTNDHP